MRYFLLIFVCSFLSCKSNVKQDSSFSKENLITKKETLKLKSISFDERNFEFVISLSNGQINKFEALELLVDSVTSFKKIDSNSFEFGNGDHYGNHISMFFYFNISDKTLYLKKIDAFFPFKQDTLGRNKYCTMDNLNIDIRTIDSEQLFDEFNTDKYCELRKDN
ncbi:hypothetical protein [Aquimarina sp. RZ0]|uniref:hypothetical protein n=1 Tax=Aquimarina sp. RZ0 TaxID=2607730 RepID=UPI0011F3599B|nr:hypothetical protein [Aquimarina sp. RZ0]KAA1244510.1 hypothetical protein F0000_16110 [Aquimarina sp. RZ0]